MCFQIVSYYRSSCVFRLSPTIKTAFSTLENAVFDQVKALVSSSFVRLYSQFLPKRILKSSQNPSKNGLLSLKICPYSKFTATYQVTATIINPLIYKKKNALVAALEQIIRNSSCALYPSSDSSPCRSMTSQAVSWLIIKCKGTHNIWDDKTFEEFFILPSFVSWFCAIFAAESCETAHARQSMQASLHSLNRSFAHIIHNRTVLWQRRMRLSSKM